MEVKELSAIKALSLIHLATKRGVMERDSQVRFLRGGGSEGVAIAEGFAPHLKA